MTYDAEIVLTLNALADPTRKRIFERLAEKSHSVYMLTQELPISQPAVSQHLKVLRDAGLVQHVKRRASHFYSVNPERVEQLQEWLQSILTLSQPTEPKKP